MAMPRNYHNGKYPSHALSTIDSHGTRLQDRAATLWRRMAYDAKTQGVNLYPTTPSSGQPDGLAGYRSLATQSWLYFNPTGPVKIAPAGSSTHGWGDTIDVGDVTARDWMYTNRKKYGLSRPFSSEPWHFQMTKTLSDLGLKPAPTNDEEDEMGVPLKIEKFGDKYAVLHPTIPGGYRLVSYSAAVAYRRVGMRDGVIGEGISKQSEWDALLAAAAQLHKDLVASQPAAAVTAEVVIPDFDININGTAMKKASA